MSHKGLWGIVFVIGVTLLIFFGVSTYRNSSSPQKLDTTSLALLEASCSNAAAPSSSAGLFFVSPTRDVIVSGTIDLLVCSLDSSAIKHISLYEDNNRFLGSADGSAFAFAWDANKENNGSHILIAMASTATSSVTTAIQVSVEGGISVAKTNSPDATSSAVVVYTDDGFVPDGLSLSDKPTLIFINDTARPFQPVFSGLLAFVKCGKANSGNPPIACNPIPPGGSFSPFLFATHEDFQDLLNPAHGMALTLGGSSFDPTAYYISNILHNLVLGIAGLILLLIMVYKRPSDQSDEVNLKEGALWKLSLYYCLAGIVGLAVFLGLAFRLAGPAAIYFFTAFLWVNFPEHFAFPSSFYSTVFPYIPVIMVFFYSANYFVSRILRKRYVAKNPLMITLIASVSFSAIVFLLGTVALKFFYNLFYVNGFPTFDDFSIWPALFCGFIFWTMCLLAFADIRKKLTSRILGYSSLICLIGFLSNLIPDPNNLSTMLSLLPLVGLILAVLAISAGIASLRQREGIDFIGIVCASTLIVFCFVFSTPIIGGSPFLCTNDNACRVLGGGSCVSYIGHASAAFFNPGVCTPPPLPPLSM